MDSTSWKAYAKIDSELEALLPHLPPRQSFADYKDAQECRQTIADRIGQAIQAGLIKPAELKDVSKSDLQIPVRDGSSIRAVQYRPASGRPGPVLVYYHGGGWLFGAPDMWEPACEVLVQQLGATVVSVDYRMAPEHVFPTAANDAIDVLHWGGDLDKGFIVSGTSAGGNLAAVAAHEAVDSNLPLTGVFLSIPVMLHPDVVPEKWKAHYNSWEQNKDAMILDKRGMLWFYVTEQYKADPESHYVSPLLWPSGHKSQPPTYFQICGMDPLRDEGLIYEHVLREECGVPTKLDIYPGIPHGGPDFLVAMPSLTSKALRDMKAGVEWLLSQKG
ncbi:hypothetical protein N0V90_000035 [Kalmusia sp. IMI 367209]|nr:hypothetical protein N0V90_000035 [Kalmusia sp. IMI 367209]